MRMVMPPEVTNEIWSSGCTTRPVIIGPVSFSRLGQPFARLVYDDLWPDIASNGVRLPQPLAVTTKRSLPGMHHVKSGDFVLKTQSDCLHAGRRPAHGPDLVFVEAQRHASGSDNDQVLFAVGEPGPA